MLTRKNNTIAELSSEKIIDHLKTLVTKEQEILSEFLEYLREFDRRKAFIKLGYSSLFDFLTRHLHYSADQSYRRISAARLTHILPEAQSKIESGELSLANATTLYQFLKIEKNIPIQKSKELLQAACIENKENLQRKLIASSLHIDAQKKLITEKVKPITQQLNTVQLCLKRTTIDKINRLRDLKSNQLHNKTQLSDLIELLVEEEIARHEKKWQVVGTEKSDHVRSNTKKQFSTLPDKVTKCKTEKMKTHTHSSSISNTRSRYIPHNVKSVVFVRDRFRCQYPGCNSTRYLHLDHVFPFSKGRSSSATNLRLLCSTHNHAKADQVTGKTQTLREVVTMLATTIALPSTKFSVSGSPKATMPSKTPTTGNA